MKVDIQQEKQESVHYQPKQGTMKGVKGNPSNLPYILGVNPKIWENPPNHPF